MTRGLSSIVVRRLRRGASSTIGRALRVSSRVWSPRQDRLARSQGLDHVVVIVSFDCDTDGDIEVVGEVHARMCDSGVVPAYCVPGQLLEAGADVYRSLAAHGAEFLNHGYHRHCTFDVATNLYESSYFYDELSWSQVEDDIRRGHAAVAEIIGVPPKGFRTPHFGTFHRPSDLQRLYGLLEALGYRFSTSTTPVHGLVHGPLPRRGTIVEIPVAGRPSSPNRVVDSWGYRFAPGRTVGPDDWVDDVRTLLRSYVESGRPGVINLYADPSQVHDWPEFFEVMRELSPHAVPSFSELLDRVSA